MAQLVFAMNMSLDGFVDHTAFGPGPALFQHFITMTRELTGSLYGRELYEIMRYWDSDAWEEDDLIPRDQLRAFAEAWRRQPKWVASRTLADVGPNTTVLGEDFAAEVLRLKQEQTGRINVGGPKLAASLADLGLLDAYEIYLRPFVIGSGAPFFARPPGLLRLVSQERIGEDAVRLVYEAG